jgi:O-antigen ligase
MKNNYLKFTQITTLWLIVFASLSNTLPTAFTSWAMGLFVIFWLSSGNYSDKLNRIRHNPAALASVALFGLYAIGIFYSSAQWNDSLNFLMKYHKLLFIPLIISVLDSDKHREYAINAFLGGMTIVLIISYLKWLGLFPHVDIGQGYIVTKGRIAHSILMSFAMFMMMIRAQKSTGAIRLTWVILSVLAGLNILFLVNGRTGMITMTALVIWFTYEKWGIKSLIYWLSLALIGGVLHQLAPNFPHSRLTDITQEIADQKNGNQTSSGQRMEMYTNTLTLIKRHPIIGGGTGSLENEYKPLAESKHLALTRVPNPHNQFLLTTQELGVIGLFALILMWYLHWKTSYQIDHAQYGMELRGLILTIVIGSLFNSLLLDAGEGKFYCVLAAVLLSAYHPAKKPIP